MLNFHRECWNPVKKHSKALVFLAVSKQIPMVYSADRGRSEINKKKKKKKTGKKKTFKRTEINKLYSCSY